MSTDTFPEVNDGGSRRTCNSCKRNNIPAICMICSNTQPTNTRVANTKSWDNFGVNGSIRQVETTIQQNQTISKKEKEPKMVCDGDVCRIVYDEEGGDYSYYSDENDN
jgi:hypothetical protein